MAIRLDNPTPEELNYLRQMYAMNGGSDTAMSGSFDAPPQQNALAQMAQPQPQQSQQMPQQMPQQPRQMPQQMPQFQAPPRAPVLTDDQAYTQDLLRKMSGLQPLGQRGTQSTFDHGRTDTNNDWFRMINGMPPAETRTAFDQRNAEIAMQSAKMANTQADTASTLSRTDIASDPTTRDLARQKTMAEIASANLNQQHTQESIRASKLNNPDYHIGDTAGLTGEAALSGVDPGTASIVKAYAEGRMAFPGGAAMRSPRMMQLLTLVGQYDPSFDATDYNLRNKTAADFASGGKSGQKVQAINQALHHAGALSDSIDSLNNTNILPGIVNPIVNYAEQKLGGDTRQGTFKMNADALAAELRKVYSGAGGGSLSELKDWQSSFDLNAGQNQQRAYLQKGMQLLNGAIDSHRDNYTRGMGPKADFGKLISPTAQADLDRVMGGNKEGSSSSNDVTLPDGRVVTFPNAAAADAYRKAKGQ